MFIKCFSKEKLEDANWRLDRKYGTDKHFEMMHEGMKQPFSKYRREMVKELIRGIMKG